MRRDCRLFEDNGIEWREDPRTSGSDCYGMLIAGKDGNLGIKAVELLETCETSLQEQFKYDTEELMKMDTGRLYLRPDGT